MNEKIKEITEKLEQGLQEVFSSDNYKEYLNTMGKFHSYSVNNSILIYMQCPKASLVAGFNAWKKNFNRTVKKGEKGIKIIAPCPYKKMVEDEETGETVEVTYQSFKVTHVFDVSQTEGDELPSIGVNELTDSVEKYQLLFDGIKTVAPVPVVMEDISDGSKGYFSLVDQKIVIKDGMSESQNFKTAVHETAHSLLHNYSKDTPLKERKDRLTKEVEAESIAYIVSQYFGIDTSSYSFGYVAGWSSGKELKELKDSLSVIQKTANDIIVALQNYIDIQTTTELSMASA